MDIEEMLFTKINELNKALIDFKTELAQHHELYFRLNNTSNNQLEQKKIYDEIKKLQLTISQTKSSLDTIISQYAFISNLNREKRNLSLDDESKLTEISQINSSGQEIPFYKKEYSEKEAEAIRQAFEAPLYEDNTRSK